MQIIQVKLLASSTLKFEAMLPHNQRKQRTFDPAANLLSQIVSRVKRRCCGRMGLRKVSVTDPLSRLEP